MAAERRRIGFYVHHHGRGHLTRALAIIDELDLPCTILSELPLTPPPGVEHVVLPADAPTRGDLDPTAEGWLHWAPLDPDRLAPRTAALAGWLAQPDVAALVCDVSVEAALTARLCGVPPIVVRQLGRRGDRAHRLGFGVAAAVLAPFPEALDDPSVDDDQRRATTYLGFVAGRRERRASHPGPPGDGRPTLVVVTGAGGTALDADVLAAAVEELPDHHVVVVGATHGVPPGATRVGWVDDVGPYLRAADVVVASAGAGIVAEVAQAGRPMVCVAEPRPFDEQLVRAEALSRLGIAVGLDAWPTRGGWRPAVERAQALGGDGWRRLGPADGAARAAEAIRSVALAPVTA